MSTTVEFAPELGLIARGWTGVEGEHLIRYSSLLRAIDWCLTNIGSENYERIGLDFYFKRPQDAMLFRLKWS